MPGGEEGMKLNLDTRVRTLHRSNIKWMSEGDEAMQGSLWWWEESRVGTVAELP